MQTRKLTPYIHGPNYRKLKSDNINKFRDKAVAKLEIIIANTLTDILAEENDQEADNIVAHFNKTRDKLVAKLESDFIATHIAEIEYVYKFMHMAEKRITEAEKLTAVDRATEAEKLTAEAGEIAIKAKKLNTALNTWMRNITI
jgi:hypothetical protein